MTTIRPATSEDLPAMVELLQLLFSIEVDFVFDKERQIKGLQLLLQAENGITLVAEISGTVIGMATGQTLISTAEGAPALHIEDVVVQANYQGKGIGGKLLEEVGKWGAERGAQRMQLLADKYNLPADKFYKKHDWQTTDLICLRKYYTPI